MTNITETATAAARALATIPGTIKENRAELVRGSVVDPFNHPSRSPKRVQQIRDNHAAFDREVAALKTKYDIP